MFGPIQSTPSGLLGLLALKGYGRFPQQLDEVVNGTISLDQFWKVAQLEQDQVVHTVTLGTAAPTVATLAPTLQVPADQWWWVERYTVEVLVPAVAGDTAHLVSPIILSTILGIGRWHALGPSYTVTGVAAGVRGVCLQAGGFWAPGGTALGFYHGGILSAGGVTFNGTVWKTAVRS